MTETTVIITLWKRNYLAEQLRALINQTVQPSAIWILQNEEHWNAEHIILSEKRRFPSIYRFKSDVNLKFHGRYSLATNISTDFVWFIDDDVIPSGIWHARCLELISKFNCIVCPTGRIIPPGDFQPELCRSGKLRDYFIGDCYNSEGFNYCPEHTYVDYGCNSYFLRTEWIRNFWTIWPSTFDLGDDIHISATSKILMDIPTMVPAQTSEKDTGNLLKSYGFDLNASWRKTGFIEKRERVLKFLVDEYGWSPLLWSRK